MRPTSSFAVSGTVTSVPVSVGQKVTKGQALARVGTADLKSAVTLAEANLTAADASLTSAEAGSSSVQLASAKAQVAQAKSNLARREGRPGRRDPALDHHRHGGLGRAERR